MITSPRSKHKLSCYELGRADNQRAGNSVSHLQPMAYRLKYSSQYVIKLYYLFKRGPQGRLAIVLFVWVEALHTSPSPNFTVMWGHFPGFEPVLINGDEDTSRHW